MKNSKSEQLLPLTIRTTRDLRLSLLQTYQDLINKRITPHEARSRAICARAVLDTVRAELVLARANLDAYKTIDLTANQQVMIQDTR